MGTSNRYPSRSRSETTAEATLLAALAAGEEATFVGLGNMVVPGLAWKSEAGKTGGRTSAGGASSGNLAERLAALGFVPGADISVESNTGRGPIIVNIRGARVAIGQGQAGRMLVRRKGVAR